MATAVSSSSRSSPSLLSTSGSRRQRRAKGACQTGREFQAGASRLQGQGDSWGRSPSRRTWAQQLTCRVCGAGGPGWDSPRELQKVSTVLPGPPPPATAKPAKLLPHREGVGSCQGLPAPGHPWAPLTWRVFLIGTEDDASLPQFSKPQAKRGSTMRQAPKDSSCPQGVPSRWGCGSPQGSPAQSQKAPVTSSGRSPHNLSHMGLRGGHSWSTEGATPTRGSAASFLSGVLGLVLGLWPDLTPKKSLP